MPDFNIEAERERFDTLYVETLQQIQNVQSSGKASAVIDASSSDDIGAVKGSEINHILSVPGKGTLASSITLPESKSRKSFQQALSSTATDISQLNTDDSITKALRSYQQLQNSFRDFCNTQDAQAAAVSGNGSVEADGEGLGAKKPHHGHAHGTKGTGSEALANAEGQMNSQESKQTLAEQQWLKEMNGWSLAHMAFVNSQAELLEQMENTLRTAPNEVNSLNGEIPGLAITGIQDLLIFEAECKAAMESNGSADGIKGDGHWFSSYKVSDFMDQLQTYISNCNGNVSEAVSEMEQDPTYGADFTAFMQANPGLQSYLSTAQNSYNALNQAQAKVAILTGEMQQAQADYPTARAEFIRISGLPPDASNAQIAQFAALIKKENSIKQRVANDLDRKMGKGGSSNGALEFTNAMGYLMQGQQILQTQLNKSVQSTENQEVNITTALQTINASISSLDKTIGVQDEKIDKLTKAITAFTVLSLVALLLPPGIRGIALLFCGLALGGLMIAKGALQVEKGHEEQQIAKDKLEYSFQNTNLQEIQTAAQQTTQLMGKLVKEMQQQDKDAIDVSNNLKSIIQG